MAAKPTAMNILHDCTEQFSKLSALVAELQNRLEPLLPAEGHDEPSSIEAPRDTSSSVSPIVSKLTAHATEIRRLQRHVETLTQRIQL